MRIRPSDPQWFNLITPSTLRFDGVLLASGPPITITVREQQNIKSGDHTQLPTGSGFYTIQPGLTFLYPSDPAVFFGGISYQYNVKRGNVKGHFTSGDKNIGDIDPGDVIGFNFGMGLALNDRSSFSIGYDHSSVGKTKVDGRYALNAVRTELGTLLLGYAHRLKDKTSLNLSVGVGVTRDTPDITLSLRLPTSF